MDTFLETLHNFWYTGVMYNFDVDLIVGPKFKVVEMCDMIHLKVTGHLREANI